MGRAASSVSGFLSLLFFFISLSVMSASPTSPLNRVSSVIRPSLSSNLATDYLRQKSLSLCYLSSYQLAFDTLLSVHRQLSEVLLSHSIDCDSYYSSSSSYSSSDERDFKRLIRDVKEVVGQCVEEFQCYEENPSAQEESTGLVCDDEQLDDSSSSSEDSEKEGQEEKLSQEY